MTNATSITAQMEALLNETSRPEPTIAGAAKEYVSVAKESIAFIEKVGALCRAVEDSMSRTETALNALSKLMVNVPREQATSAAMEIQDLESDVRNDIEERLPMGNAIDRLRPAFVGSDIIDYAEVDVVKAMKGFYAIDEAMRRFREKFADKDVKRLRDSIAKIEPLTKE